VAFGASEEEDDSMKHVYNALLSAEQAHRGQVRKYSGDPYVLHPIRVAHMVAYAGYDDEAQAAALLHDVPEDTAITLADLARDTRVSPRTLKLVTALTKWWSDHQQDQTAEKAEYYGRILLDPEAIGLKVADRIDNISEMITLWNRDDIKNGTRRWIERTSRRPRWNSRRWWRGSTNFRTCQRLSFGITTRLH